ncbi:MAG: CcmD family protein [Chloroflexi bacterium]|nr:CcmD family protein [Chloroflexota bacterium]MDA1174146.1 CcmD family protein [Chloroflexota bacterium]
MNISTISKRTRIAIGLAIVAILALPTTVLAATSAQEIPGESNLGFLLVGEIIVWAGFFAYAFYMSRKTNDLRREIDDLRAQLKAGASRDL